MNITIDTLIRLTEVISALFFMLFIIKISVMVIKEKDTTNKTVDSILYASWVIDSLLFIALMIVKYL